MARYKNQLWNLPDSLQNWEQVNTAVLMDIRDELQTLNRLLHCGNFTGIPRTLAVALRKKIVDAHRDLLVTERILDLEDQVKSLVEQVNKANAEKESLYERLR